MLKKINIMLSIAMIYEDAKKSIITVAIDPMKMNYAL